MEISIKDLYVKIIAFEGEKRFETVLKNWVFDNNYKSILRGISNKLQSDNPSLSQEDIWELYALTSVLDILTLQFQPNNNADASEWKGPKITIPDYIEFVHLLGLDIANPQSFNPFDCEIMEAEPGEIDFKIIENIFPSVKLKNLMIKRAGIRVSVNPQKHDLRLINNASIYWASRRKNRKYFDLSQGWGSNSQWRTDFRIDLETPECFKYNMNGKFDLNNLTDKLEEELKQQNLELKEAIELTKFRHFIECTKDDTDLFPYDFKYEEKRNLI